MFFALNKYFSILNEKMFRWSEVNSIRPKYIVNVIRFGKEQTARMYKCWIWIMHGSRHFVEFNMFSDSATISLHYFGSMCIWFYLVFKLPRKITTPIHQPNRKNCGMLRKQKQRTLWSFLLHTIINNEIPSVERRNSHVEYLKKRISWKVDNDATKYVIRKEKSERKAMAFDIETSCCLRCASLLHNTILIWWKTTFGRSFGIFYQKW